MDMTKYMSNTLNVQKIKDSPSKQMVVITPGIEKAMQDNKIRAVLMIEMDGQQLEWIPNGASIKAIKDVHGLDSTAWVGKQFMVEVGDYNGKEIAMVKPVVTAPAPAAPPPQAPPPPPATADPQTAAQAQEGQQTMAPPAPGGAPPPQ